MDDLRRWWREPPAGATVAAVRRTTAVVSLAAAVYVAVVGSLWAIRGGEGADGALLALPVLPVVVNAAFVLSLRVAAVVLALLGAATAVVLALLGVGAGSIVLLLVSWALVAALTAWLARMGELAEEDSLTGVLTSRGMYRRFDAVFAATRRDGRPLSLVLFDLDRFKALNDVCGHVYGDEILQAYARAWRPLIPEGAEFARPAGDEFAVLLPGHDGASAVAFAERLLAARPQQVSVSAGIAELSPIDEPSHLRRKAEQALHDAKRSGRDQVVLFAAGGLLRPDAEDGRSIDPVTGLLFYDPADDHTFRESSPSGWAALVAEVDNYLATTQVVGFEAGDLLLAEGAERILSVTSPYRALVRRLQGPHFLVLVPGQDDDAIQELADQLAYSSERHTSGQRGGLIVGAAVSPRDGTEVQALTRAAMTAAAYAKRHRPGSAAFFHARMADDARDRLAIGRALRTAIDRRELTLAFQPQLDLADGSLVGVEVLARWSDPLHGTIAPDRFVKIAEEIGLSRQLDRLIFEQALAQLRAWDDAGVPVPRISVNVSSETLGGRPLGVPALLARHGIAPERLTVELIESRLLDETAGAAVLRRFRDLGVRVSLDDFGTGYSSFSQLVSLPVSELKIDRSFLTSRGGADETVVGAIVQVGTALGLDVVAEGIETQEQLELLRELGCPVGQGYLFAHPLTAAELVDWLARPMVPRPRTGSSSIPLPRR